MAYVPPSQRGGNFKSRAEGETIPTLTTANLKEEVERFKHAEERLRDPEGGNYL